MQSVVIDLINEDTSDQSSRLSSCDDDFKENIAITEAASTTMQARLRSKSTSNAVPWRKEHNLTLHLSSESTENSTKRCKPVFERSISAGMTEHHRFVATHCNQPRMRSKSCVGASLNLSNRTSKTRRLRKISTNSLGNFGKGFEGLLLSKPEVVLTPNISREQNQQVTKKTEVDIDKHSDEENEAQETLVKENLHSQLDHGYAWVIVLGAGLAFFLGGGFGRCFPLIYQRLMERFESSATATAWVAAMHGAVKLCSSEFRSLIYPTLL